MNKYEIRQTLHRAPLAVAVGSVLAAGAAKNAHAQNIVVTTDQDAPLGTITGACTLRDAVESANTASAVGGCDAGNNVVDVIGFDSSLEQSSITLAHGEMAISHGGFLYFYGPEEGYPAGITIDAANASRIFRFQDGSRVTLRDMTLTRGSTSGVSERGGAVAAYDTDLVLEGSRVMNSSTGGQFADGGGVAVVNGNLRLRDSSFISDNMTSGDYAGGGGALVQFGDFSMDSSLVAGNETHGEFAAGGGISVISGNATLLASSVSGNATTGNFASGGGLYMTTGDLDMRAGGVRNNSTAGSLSYGGGVFVRNGDVELSLATVSGNTTSGDEAGGGGVAAIFSEVSLSNATISENSTTGADALGGGLFVLGDFGATHTISNSTLTGNSTEGSRVDGGGVYVRNSASGALHLTGGQLSGNTASGYGGGLSAHYGAVVLNHATVTGNSALEGGGIEVRNVNASLDNSTVSGNSADAFYGGGIFVRNGDVSLDNSTVSGNSALYYGGGIFVRDGGASLTNSTFSGNSSGEYGGAIFVSEYGDIELSNSTISGNSAGYSGGGLWVDGDATLTHVTVAFNNAGSYTGIYIYGYSYGNLTLNNSLIVQPGATACNQAADSHINTLATDASCTGQATDAAAIDLAPLAGLGGPTETHALGVGSVAINGAGDCTADFGIDADQRGLPRPGGDSSVCDIGAFEVQGDGDGDTIFQDRFEE